MSGTFASSLRDEPDYYLCPICADRYTMERGRPCHACREQEMIDTYVLTPFDWGVWDEDEEQQP